MRSGDWVDGIQISYIAAGGQYGDLPWRGGKGGRQRLLFLGNDQFITRIWGYHGKFVDYLGIVTAGSKESGDITFAELEAGGYGGDAYFRYESPPGMQIVGFCGYAGQHLDAIGVVLRSR